MDNDIFKSQKNEDEYHFSENNNTSAFTSDSGSSGATDNKVQFFEKIKRKNVVIAVIIILVVLSIYKLIDVFSSSTNRKTHTSITNTASRILSTAAIPVSEIDRTNIQSAEKALQPTNQSTAVSVVSNNVTGNRLNNLEAQETALQNTVDKLSNQLNDLQNSISNFDSRLSSLSQNIQDMATKQEQLLKQQEDKKKALQKKTQQNLKAKPIPIYYVKAVIPGRAWLTSKDKTLVTVSIGDNLPGYGVIESIDTNQGTVVTNSGAIIGYDPDNG